VRFLPIQAIYFAATELLCRKTVWAEGEFFPRRYLWSAQSIDGIFLPSMVM